MVWTDIYQRFPYFFDRGQELGCVRKQIPERFGAYRFLPYLCIVNQGKTGCSKDN